MSSNKTSGVNMEIKFDVGDRVDSVDGHLTDFEVIEVSHKKHDEIKYVLSAGEDRGLRVYTTLLVRQHFLKKSKSQSKKPEGRYGER